MISEKIVALFIPIICSLGAFTMIVFIRKFENDEKMAMIAKGIMPPPKGLKVNPANSLRLGLLAIGVGLGLLVGNFLETYVGFSEDVAYFSMIFIFGGLGLLASYFLQMKINKQNEEES